MTTEARLLIRPASTMKMNIGISSATGGITISARFTRSSASRKRIALKTIAYAASTAIAVEMDTEHRVTIALLSAHRGTGRSTIARRRFSSVGCDGNPVGLSVYCSLVFSAVCNRNQIGYSETIAMATI